MTDIRIADIWRQRLIPVLFKRSSNELLVKLPYESNNREWLRNEKHRIPVFEKKWQAWNIPVAWFEESVRRTLKKYGQVYIIQHHREQQKCAPACWNAKSFTCECSCMGANHGNGFPGGHWHEVAETFAFSYGPRQYACRLLVCK